MYIDRGPPRLLASGKSLSGSLPCPGCPRLMPLRVSAPSWVVGVSPQGLWNVGELFSTAALSALAGSLAPEKHPERQPWAGSQSGRGEGPGEASPAHTGGSG